MTQAHLAVIQSTETGLFHGALYVNRPTPSGCDRYVLTKSTSTGYGTRRTAALVINNDFPDLESLDLANFGDEEDVDIEGLIEKINALPPRAELTLVTPKRKYNEPPYVEVSIGIGKLIDLQIPAYAINMLLAQQVIELDSRNACAELAASYQHYRIIRNKQN